MPKLNLDTVDVTLMGASMLMARESGPEVPPALSPSMKPLVTAPRQMAVRLETVISNEGLPGSWLRVKHTVSFHLIARYRCPHSRTSPSDDHTGRGSRLGPLRE